MQPTRQSRRRAFTLVEVILSLVILAILMAALGAAFQGSTNSYAASEGLTEMINTARQALLRITADIRTAQGVAPIDGGGSGDIDNHQCSLIRADGTHVTYHYNTSTAASYNTALDDQTLYLIINSGASAGTYRLCDHVLDMTFERGTDGVNVRNVRIGMTLTDDTGQPPQTLHTAAVVRTLP
ncbi:MAG TPA: type II secretion system protein [Phycisphaerales bacterium]|mgnify:FL=1|nr:type II secretion system protein [Phycisphaerales bacterium]